MDEVIKAEVVKQVDGKQFTCFGWIITFKKVKP